MFHEQIAETGEHDSHRKRYNYRNDVHSFVEEYKEDRLFSVIPGREHHAFPGFKLDTGMKNPEKLKKRLLKYSRKLDRTRAVLD